MKIQNLFIVPLIFISTSCTHYLYNEAFSEGDSKEAYVSGKTKDALQTIRDNLSRAGQNSEKQNLR